LDLHETDSLLDSQLGPNRPDIGFFVEDLQRREDAVMTRWELAAWLAGPSGPAWRL